MIIFSDGVRGHRHFGAHVVATPIFPDVPCKVSSKLAKNDWNDQKS